MADSLSVKATEPSIDQDTTPQDLFDQIYADNMDNFGTVYAELLEKYPDHAEMIKEAWLKTTMFDMSFDEFRQYIFDSLGEPGIFDGQYNY